MTSSVRWWLLRGRQKLGIVWYPFTLALNSSPRVFINCCSKALIKCSPKDVNKVKYMLLGPDLWFFVDDGDHYIVREWRYQFKLLQNPLVNWVSYFCWTLLQTLEEILISSWCPCAPHVGPQLGHNSDDSRVQNTFRKLIWLIMTLSMYWLSWSGKNHSQWPTGSREMCGYFECLFIEAWWCVCVSSYLASAKDMMTSSNGNIFCVTGHLWRESTGHRWIPLTKANDTKLWYLYPRPTKLEGGYTGFTLSVCPSVCRRHGFRSISQVCFGISISNFICMLMVAIGRSLLIFSDVTFKMAAWRPYWIFWFPDSNFTEYQFQTSAAQYLCIWVGAYWFSATSFSKWPPGGHIWFFGVWTL